MISYVRELTYAYRTTTVEDSTPRIHDAKDLATWIRPFLESEPVEVVVVIVLDNRNQPLCYHVVGRGTLNAAPVHPRDVFRPAITANGASVVLAHNHPSGDSTPSQPDIVLARRLKDAGDLLGIPLIDSLIIGVDSHSSMREGGII